MPTSAAHELRVSVDMRDEGIAHVRLNRAEKMNALDSAMFDALIDAGHQLSGLAGLRCVVLSGEGRSFCAGLDLTMFQSLLGKGAPDLADRSYGDANLFQQVAMQWRGLPVPVVAAIHGVCYGGGLQIAAGADIRIAAPDARLAVMETKWGIIPDMGHFALWRGLVREDVLRELTYTAQEFSGEQAQALGFVTHVDADPLERAWAIARAVAGKNPHAIRAAKRLFNQLPEMTQTEILLGESHEQAQLIGSTNQIEAVQSAMGGRAARFAEP